MINVLPVAGESALLSTRISELDVRKSYVSQLASGQASGLARGQEGHEGPGAPVGSDAVRFGTITAPRKLLCPLQGCDTEGGA